MSRNPATPGARPSAAGNDRRRATRPAAARRAGAALLGAVALSLLTACAGPAHQAAPAGPPNLLVVFVDDMGWGDASYQADPGFAMPHLQRLADEGARFSDFYAAQPVCSASRAALLTGCYPNRLGIHGALGPNANHGLAESETTLAELAKSRGYATALFGKWHLGHRPPFLPTRHGFDRWHGIPYSNDMWPGHPENPKHWGDLPTFRDEQVVAYNGDQRRFTSDFSAGAAAFIEESVAAGRPFFAYLAQPMPHVPLYVLAESEGRSGAGLYGDVLTEIDDGLGLLLDTLERLGVDDETLVVFTSDNGPWLSYGDHAGSTGGFREGKGTTFEGGVRVPAVMRWPGVIPPGTLVSEPAMTIDVLPTVARLLDVPLPEHGVDGQDIWPLVIGEPGARSPHESYVFYYHANHLEALRAGRWKLHLPHGYRSMQDNPPGTGGVPGKYVYGVPIELSLFDLEADPYETTDVKDSHPEVLEQLLAMVERWRADLGDKLTEREGSGRREPGRWEPGEGTGD